MLKALKKLVGRGQAERVATNEVQKAARDANRETAITVGKMLKSSMELTKTLEQQGLFNPQSVDVCQFRVKSKLSGTDREPLLSSGSSQSYRTTAM